MTSLCHHGNQPARDVIVNCHHGNQPAWRHCFTMATKLRDVIARTYLGGILTLVILNWVQGGLVFSLIQRGCWVPGMLVYGGFLFSPWI